jgi:hypothetical protein
MPPGGGLAAALAALIPQASSMEQQAAAAQQASPILAMLAQKLAEAPNPAALAASSEPAGEPYDGPDAEGADDQDSGGY